MDKAVKILLLEDNKYDAELINHQISKTTLKYQLKHVSKLDDFSNAIDTYIPDIILSDYNLLGFKGLDALDLAIQKCPLIPFIIVTGTINEETAAETIKKGAWDYVVKERLTRLSSAMRNALQLKEEIEKSTIDREKLKISEERFKLAIEGSQDGIWDWDLKSDTIYFSKRWKSMLGYKNQELKNNYKTWESLLHPDDKKTTLASLEKHMKKETPFYQTEFRLKCKDGHYKWISARGKAIYDQDGNPYRVAGSQTDISERKLMDENLIKAKEKAEESDRLKSAFLANMSHEIRTPMNGILGFAELLKKPNLTGEKQQKYIDIIEKSGARMLNIINNIISVSKIESGQMEVNIQESNINEQIEYIYSFFKPEVEGKGMQISFINSLPLEEAIIKTDSEKVYAILINLVKNAIKYSEKGTIEFGYNIKKGSHPVELEFYVKDTGIGIPKDRQKAVFERFIQADIADKMALQGAGLGLSISKSYIEMLGGKIWVESEEGKGSTFYFTLPYQTEKHETNHAINPKTEEVLIPEELSSKNKLKILIVENDETSEQLISIITQSYEKEIISVKTGIDAIRACRNHPDIDLVLMDIQIPELNGYKATHEIRKFNKDIIIIAQTAYALESDKEKALAAGCNDYIAKPIKENELKLIITKHMNKNK